MFDIKFYLQLEFNFILIVIKDDIKFHLLLILQCGSWKSVYIIQIKKILNLISTGIISIIESIYHRVIHPLGLQWTESFSLLINSQSLKSSVIEIIEISYESSAPLKQE